ncbi:hypothetical protein [Pseudoalteromonas denitrificans]|nr:hypothetical protein [Pseudoalteromonas denitrificans]
MIGITSITLLVGCSNEGDIEQVKLDKPVIKNLAKQKEHLFQSQALALEKAKGVQSMLDEAQKNQQKKLKEAINN